MKSNNGILIMYPSNVEHNHVISQLEKSEIETQLLPT
jgi:hypothetical protein